MKLKLFAKLFLLLLLGMLLLLGSMMLSVHLTFKQGLSGYLRKTEQLKLEQLALQLGDYYQQHGDWSMLQNNPHAWFAWLDKSTIAQPPSASQAAAEIAPPTDSDAETPRRPPTDFSAPPRPRPHRPSRPKLQLDVDRLSIWDNDGWKIIGPPEADTEVAGEQKIQILANNQPAGWLLAKPNPLISDQLAVDFMRQQLISNLWILALAVLVSIFMALWMARQIVRPLRRIATGTRALTAGQFATQIAEHGHDELAELAKDFNLLGRTLAQSEKARQQWIADISHELRTPLAVLRGELDALVDGIRSATPDRIRSLHQEVLALTRLVDDLYQLSLSDLGTLDYQFQRLELTQLLEQIVDSFQTRFAAKSLQLSLQAPGPALFINGDTLRLGQLFSNLLENSYRYSDAGGCCQVTITRQAQATQITIADSAPGVAAAELPLLFERFHRVDRSRQRQAGGAGLGLAICRNIVEAHRGSISAGPSAQGGIQMTVTLPD